jgi:hypothetical protein
VWEKVKPYIIPVALFLAGIIGGTILSNLGNRPGQNDIYFQRLDDAIQRIESGSGELEEQIGGLIESTARLQNDLSTSVDRIGETVKLISSGSDRVEVIAGNVEGYGKELEDIYRRVREEPVTNDIEP